MRRNTIMDQLKGKCKIKERKLYLELQEEIRDFFYKYDLFNSDNVYSKLQECIIIDEYLSYEKISEQVAINVKGVIKFIEKYENFVKKILEFPKYKALKELVDTTK